MSKSIPFIIFQNDQYSINPQAEQVLQSFDKENIVVLSVVGKYRTGKSYLINRVILQQKDGFNVGSTINACTKGIWMWPQLLDHPDNPNIKCLVLDTEGFGGLEQNLNHDGKINLLALLLSSLFIYNSSGQLDESALQNLSLVINLASQLTKDQKIEDYPDLIWILRDFALQMVDSKNNDITSRQYLENALQNAVGMSEVIEQKNKVRQKIKSFFKNRECVTLVRPIEDEQKLQNLDQQDQSLLRNEFVQGIKQLRQMIFNKIEQKSLQNKQITCQNLLDMSKQYINSLNSGQLPNIQNAWFYVCKNECLRAIKMCLNQADKQLNGQKYTQIQFDKIKKDIIYEADSVFKKMNFTQQEETEQFYNKMMEQLMDKLNKYEKENLILIQNEYKESINEIQNQLIQMINDNKIKDFNNLNSVISQKMMQFLSENDNIDQQLIFNMKIECYRKFFINIDQIKNQYINQLQDIQKDYNNLKKENSKYQNGQKKTQLENSQNSQVILDLKEQNIQKTQQYQDLHKQNNSLQLQLNEIKLEANFAKQQVTDMKDQNKKLNQNNKNLTDELQNYKKQQFGHQNEIIMQQKISDSFNNDTQQYKNQIISLQNEVQQEQKQIKKIQEEIHMKDVQISSLSDENLIKFNKIKELQKYIENIKNKYKQLKAERNGNHMINQEQFENLKNKVQDYIQQIQNLQSDQDKLLTDIETLTQQNYEQKFAIKKFESKQYNFEQEKQDTINQYELQIQEYQMQIETIQQIQQTKEQESNQKDNKIKEIERQLQELNHKNQLLDKNQSENQNFYKEMQKEYNNLLYINQNLKLKLQEKDQDQNYEALQLQANFEKRIQMFENEKDKEYNQKQLDSEIPENLSLEKQIKILKAQNEETKQLNEALMQALSQENKDIPLSVEQQQKQQEKEKKNQLLKQFKKNIEQNVLSLSCMHCQKSYSLHIFNRHLNKCLNDSQQQTLLVGQNKIFNYSKIPENNTKQNSSKQESDNKLTETNIQKTKLNRNQTQDLIISKVQTVDSLLNSKILPIDATIQSLSQKIKHHRNLTQQYNIEKQ